MKDEQHSSRVIHDPLTMRRQYKICGFENFSIHGLEVDEKLSQMKKQVVMK